MNKLLGKPLNQREQYIVKKVVQGVRYALIAKSLGGSEISIRRACTRIYDKLGVANRYELVTFQRTKRIAQLEAQVTALTLDRDKYKARAAMSMGDSFSTSMGGQ